MGFFSNEVSTSMGLSVRAISWTLSTILPDLAKSLASILYLPLTSLNLMSAISSMDLPTHLSGVSIREVSPNSAGRSGPISTLG